MIAGGGVAPLIALAGLVALAGVVVVGAAADPATSAGRGCGRSRRCSRSSTALLTAVVTGDFLGVGAQFLVWLDVAKAYNRRAARDWQQMYLLSFLMLVAGSVLNADLTYGLCFLGFVIAATWALTLFHLRREMEDNLLVKHAADRASERVEVRRILDSKRIVGGRFFVGTGAAVARRVPRVGRRVPRAAARRLRVLPQEPRRPHADRVLRQREARRPRRAEERRHRRDARRARLHASAAATRQSCTGAASRSITTRTAAGA